jgi:hypothetical protein
VPSVSCNTKVERLHDEKNRLKILLKGLVYAADILRSDLADMSMVKTPKK